MFPIIIFSFLFIINTIFLLSDFAFSNNTVSFPRSSLIAINEANGSESKDAFINLKGKVLPDDKLIQHALETINQDRSELGLHSLNLSENKAAQIHAEELFQIKDAQPTHLSKNGMKPYMMYSVNGGTNFMQQNVAISGYDNQEIKRCKESRCIKLDPYEQISKAEWSMIHNDTICCNDGHRKNILDSNHTHVSIGIAYNDYYFVLVQNFENNYLSLNQPITQDNKHVQISGRIEPSNDTYTIGRIGIYYDPPPTDLFYEQNKSMNSYTLGDLVAIVVKPAPLFQDYEKPVNYTLIEASTWNDDHKMVDIKFDLTSIKLKPGVYTIVTYIEDSKKNIFPAMLYSIFQ